MTFDKQSYKNRVARLIKSRFYKTILKSLPKSEKFKKFL